MRNLRVAQEIRIFLINVIALLSHVEKQFKSKKLKLYKNLSIKKYII